MIFFVNIFLLIGLVFIKGTKEIKLKVWYMFLEEEIIYFIYRMVRVLVLGWVF